LYTSARAMRYMDTLRGNTVNSSSSPATNAASLLSFSMAPVNSSWVENTPDDHQVDQKPPAFDSTEDFPPVAPRPASSGETGNLPTAPRGFSNSANFAKAAKEDPMAPAKATVADMKKKMGPKFKDLKTYTKQFAAGEMEPESYIDSSASLFDQGSKDPDFWSFLPSLLESCPDLYHSARAIRYMESLRTVPNGGGSHDETNFLKIPASHPSLANKDLDEHIQQATKQNSPELNSTADFPPVALPPKAKNEPKEYLKKQAPTSQSQATVADMKAALGPKYKELKNFTKDFVSGELQPDAYVDHCAALFQQGYADPHFWRFVPTLVESCPDLYASAQALRYMETLKKMRNGALNAESVAPKTAPSAGTSHPQLSSLSKPSVSASTTVRSTTATSASKTKNAWGAAGGGATAIQRAKAPPGSVAVAAATAGPQIGTATKFMAKQMKQEKQQQANASSGTPSGARSKQKNELRNLAFGR